MYTYAIYHILNTYHILNAFPFTLSQYFRNFDTELLHRCFYIFIPKLKLCIPFMDKVTLHFLYFEPKCS